MHPGGMQGGMQGLTHALNAHRAPWRSPYPLPPPINEFFDRQVESVKEFCVRQRERVELTRRGGLHELEVVAARMKQEHLDAQLDNADEELRKIDEELAALQGTRLGRASSSQNNTVSGGSGRMGDTVSPRESVTSPRGSSNSAPTS